MSRELFASHPRSWGMNRHAYPVVSRRSRGLSLGVNLNPDKACNFDCVYCSVDRRIPGSGREVDLARLERELDGLLQAAMSGAIWQVPPFDATPAPLRRLNDVAFSGDGEPTSCPGFAAAVGLVGTLLARYRAPARPILITNASLLHRAEVQAGVEELLRLGGEVWAKLDAGSEDWYRRIDRSRIPLERVLENLRDLGRRHPLVIQALFCRIEDRDPPEAELDAWGDRLAELLAAGCRIRLVQVYTTARATAESWVEPLPEAGLEAIAARARALGLATEVYP